MKSRISLHSASLLAVAPFANTALNNKSRYVLKYSSSVQQPGLWHLVASLFLSAVIDRSLVRG
jgi:TRAP-type mannitol/chloroaromatic compound transport system permease small subunit